MPKSNYIALGRVTFPPHQDRYVNMMPYVMGVPTSVPRYLRDYLPLIEKCEATLDRSQLGRVGYLTMDERVVRSDGTHRRPGIHTEAHGTASGGAWGGGGWGGGRSEDGGNGLFLANTLHGSCVIYDADVADSGPGGEVTAEQLQGVTPVLMDAHTLYWMHDRTPHGARWTPSGPDRQFFRLVTSAVDVWYAQHSTPSPLGVIPPPTVTVVDGSKFA